MNPETVNLIDDAVVRLRRGDPEAIGVLISRYQHRLYRYLLRIVKEPGLAEDLFQQTWLRLMEKSGQYDPHRSFEMWMFAVAHNLAIDHLRGRRGSSLDEADEFGTPRIDHLASKSPDALEELLEYERGAVLSAAISELPAIHREVISLRFEEEMKLEEIACVVGLPLSTVKSWLSRALESLRALLEKPKS